MAYVSVKGALMQTPHLTNPQLPYRSIKNIFWGDSNKILGRILVNDGIVHASYN